RHTRSYGDWSSDVCSSDLSKLINACPTTSPSKIVICMVSSNPGGVNGNGVCTKVLDNSWLFPLVVTNHARCPSGFNVTHNSSTRSEERRVGKECRSLRWM